MKERAHSIFKDLVRGGPKTNLCVLLCLLVFPLTAQNILLEDFNNLRINPNTSISLFRQGSNPNQTGGLDVSDGDSRYKVTATAPFDVYNYGVYFWLFDLGGPGGSRFSFPGGFLQSWIKSGTWDPMTNRMEFWVKCSENHGFAPWRNSYVGTYVKPHDYSNIDSQGQHYYHLFHANYYANTWLKFTINETPSVQVAAVCAGDGRGNCNADPEYVSPTLGSPVHYFDGMTEFYFTMDDGGGKVPNKYPYSCWLDDFRLSTVNNEPDYYVKSVGVTYNGTAYEVSWNGMKGLPQQWTVHYSTSSMKANGFNSGSGGGTCTLDGKSYTSSCQNSGSAYAGILWKSPPMPQAAGMYFAIQPAGQSQFSEIFFPMVEGQTAASACDLNGDGVVDAVDVQQSINEALGVAPCKNDLDLNGKCDVVDVQRVVDATLGGTCRAGT